MRVLSACLLSSNTICSANEGNHRSRSRAGYAPLNPSFIPLIGMAIGAATLIGREHSRLL
jgi:hypothetical protein